MHKAEEGFSLHFSQMFALISWFEEHITQLCQLKADCGGDLLLVLYLKWPIENMIINLHMQKAKTVAMLQFNPTALRILTPWHSEWPKLQIAMGLIFPWSFGHSECRGVNI